MRVGMVRGGDPPSYLPFGVVVDHFVPAFYKTEHTLIASLNHRLGQEELQRSHESDRSPPSSKVDAISFPAH